MTVGVSSESVVVTDYQHFAPEVSFLEDSLCNCMILFAITIANRVTATSGVAIKLLAQKDRHRNITVPFDRAPAMARFRD